MNTLYLMFFGGGIALGWASSNFVYGRKYCYDCWIALIKGKRDIEGCENCVNWLASERVK